MRSRIQAIGIFDRIKKVRCDNLLNIVRRNLEKLNDHDDSIEGQAKTFRLWVLVSGLTLLFCAISMSSEKSSGPEQPEPTFLTEIPDGMIAVPITASNYSAIDTLLGVRSWADLYIPSFDGTRGTKIAESVPLLRLQEDRKRLVVLLPEDTDSPLTTLSDPVIIILRKSPKMKDIKKTAVTFPSSDPLRRKNVKRLNLLTEKEVPDESE